MSFACADLQELVAAQALGVLEPSEEERVEAHLAVCTTCPELHASVEKALAQTVPVVVPAGDAGELSWLAIEERLSVDTVREEQTAKVAVRVSLSCSYCHSGLTRSEAAFCASCLAPHHVDCFVTHGQCSALGCTETEVVRPGKPTAPRRRRGLRLVLTGLGVVGSAAAALTVAAASFSLSPQAPKPRPTPPPATAEVAPVPEAEPPPTFNADLPAETQWELGFKRLGAGQLQDAITYFTWALERDPNLVKAYVHRGVALTESGKLEEAIADFSRAIELDPRRVSAYRGRAEAQILRGDRERGINDLEDAIKIDRREVKSLVRLGTLRLQEAKDDAAKLDMAFNHFLRAIERNPRSVEAWTGRALARQRMGDVESAVKDFGRAIELDPTATDALLGRAKIRLAAGETFKAIEDLDALLRRNPGNAQILVLRAQARLATGNRDYALLDLAAAIRLDPSLRSTVDLEEYVQTVPLERALAHRPTSALLHYMRGRAHHREGSLREAVASYRKSLEIDPTDVQARLQVIRALYALGDAAGAKRIADQLLKENPGEAEVYAIRGQVSASRGQFKAAVADLQRAIEMNPGRARTHSRLADAYAAQGRHLQAIKSYSRALELDATLVTTYVQRGASFQALGKLEQAKVDYEWALDSHPNLAVGWLKLGLLNEQTGDGQRAIEGLQRFLRLTPSGPRRAEAVTALARLGVTVELPAAPEVPPGPTTSADTAPEGTQPVPPPSEAPAQHPSQAVKDSLRVGDIVRIQVLGKPDGVVYRILQVGPSTLRLEARVPGTNPPEFSDQHVVDMDFVMMSKIERIFKRVR